MQRVEMTETSHGVGRISGGSTIPAFLSYLCMVLIPWSVAGPITYF